MSDPVSTRDLARQQAEIVSRLQKRLLDINPGLTGELLDLTTLLDSAIDKLVSLHECPR